MTKKKMIKKKNEWIFEAIISVLVILLVIGGIIFKSYYDKRVEEAAIQEEKEIVQDSYIRTLKRLDVYSGKESMYEYTDGISQELTALVDVSEVEMINPETGEANIGLMHSTELGNFYIYDDYLKMLLRAHYIVLGEEFSTSCEGHVTIYSYDKIISMNENCIQEEAETLSYLTYHYPEHKDIYLEKVSKAYDKYLEVNGEKYAGKEKYQLNYEDCLALEEYFEEEPAPEETMEADYE